MKPIWIGTRCLYMKPSPDRTQLNVGVGRAGVLCHFSVDRLPLNLALRRAVLVYGVRWYLLDVEEGGFYGHARLALPWKSNRFRLMWKFVWQHRPWGQVLQRFWAEWTQLPRFA